MGNNDDIGEFIHTDVDNHYSNTWPSTPVQLKVKQQQQKDLNIDKIK